MGSTVNDRVAYITKCTQRLQNSATAAEPARFLQMLLLCSGQNFMIQISIESKWFTTCTEISDPEKDFIRIS